MTDRAPSTLAQWELANSFELVKHLMSRENQLYGRTWKSRDHILAFLSADNVSTAVIDIGNGPELLDKRTDKPEYKESELVEGARAVKEALNKLRSSEGSTEATVELMHVISEAGDVFYNLLQLLVLEEGQLRNAGWIKHIINTFFTEHTEAELIHFITNVALRKFSIRYFEVGKKNVEYEEAKLLSEFERILLNTMDTYVNPYGLLNAIKSILLASVGVAIIASNGDEYMVNQIVKAGNLISEMNGEEHSQSES